MLPHVDWQMVAFVATSLFHEYWFHVRVPQIYYFEVQWLDSQKKTAA